MQFGRNCPRTVRHDSSPVTVTGSRGRLIVSFVVVSGHFVVLRHPFAAGCYCGGGGGTAPPHPPGGAGCGMAPPPTTHCNPGETIPYGCPIIGAPY